MELREQLRRQGMAGLTVHTAAQTWDGHLYRSLETATRAATKASGEVVLVRNDGRLYHQADGKATGPVLIAGQHRRVDLRCRAAHNRRFNRAIGSRH